MNIIPLLDKLTLESDGKERSEYAFETMSMHVLNVDTVSKQALNDYAKSLEPILGQPFYNFCIDNDESFDPKPSVTMPDWSEGTPIKGKTSKTNTLIYWIRENLIFYLTLRHEFGSGSTPIYYTLHIGFKKNRSKNTYSRDGITSLKNMSIDKKSFGQRIFETVSLWIK